MMKTSRKIKSALAMAASSVLLLLAGCGSDTKEATLSETLKTPEAKVSEVTVSSFRIDWDKVYGAENYTYSLDGAEADSTKSLSVTFNGLEAAKEYVVKLQAEPAKGGSKTSSEPVYIHVRTSDVSQLEKPEITVGSAYASKTIISWSVIPGAGSYEYTIGDISGTTTENRVTLSNLAKGTDYIFTVKAIPAGSGNTASEYAQASFTTSSEDVPALLIVPENVLADAVVFDVYATPDATFYYDVVSSSTLMQFDEATVIERYRSAIIEYAKSKGISLQLAIASVLKVGTNTIGVSSLASEMSYDIIAFGMDYNGNVTTGLYTKRITTTATGWSSGPNYGGSSWFDQNFYLTNAYLGMTGYGWTNSVWTTWKGRDVQSIRYRLLPTSTFNSVFSDPYDKEAVKAFLRDTSYSYAVRSDYLALVNSSNGYNSVTPCNSGVSYTMSALATSASGEEELTVNSITTKTTSEAYTWFSIAALVNEKYGPTSSKMACVLKGVGIESGRLVIIKTAALANVPESSYPAIIADKGTELKESYLEYINGNGLALVVDVEPQTSYTVMATVVNKAGDKLTKHASVTTTAAETKAARTRATAVSENLAANAEASPVGLRLDGVEAIPVFGTPTSTEDLWTIIHNMNIFGTNYEK
ncbi:MAG TPA: hypothetical protein DDX40_10335 [Rikenellaceae bacterium]|nr:hypothetical protein [Rikenellaceae bacterium]